jgi:sterol desaturase/sphingolipid hydroxylase (fatty acid hydroxylase superfamily)
MEGFVTELINFFQLSRIIDASTSGAWTNLDGFDWAVMLLAPVVPISLALEFCITAMRKKASLPTYRVNLLIYAVNRVIGLTINLSVAFSLIYVLNDYAMFQTSLTWYWFIYAYLVWELGQYVYHILSHKVRVLWCLHSTHHAAEDMNISVSYAHFFLEGTFANLIRIPVATLGGVDPKLLTLILLVAPIYGSLIHTSEALLPRGRIGLLRTIFLSPSDHRVHHAKNPIYIDRNYCNLFSIWDRLFGTYQPELDEIPIEYGITRNVDAHKFTDVYFGEFSSLFKDFASASGVKNKFMYLVMPPGWRPSGQHMTAAQLRRRFIANNPTNHFELQ